ncbi:coagulation factor 5/8 type-like protein [Brevibacillus fluminis]|uniref:Coagulation factor 5/8 type-like protein n=1 Tax=Brevibacillus fluminis TaxID=511487 RepID=A0A3M8DZU7_9BACL|nr:coagulation factor 5/8 type-like protein [Brevibacillus fluminis]RNB92507.1 coagulation factor 5/8 type-like protein [Brevibacillus fluminis]
MSLTHEFFLISNDFDLNYRYEWYRTNRYTWDEKSEVSDDIIQYMMDFLNWLPSYNPETKESDKGLNYYGVTVINKPGAEKLIKILGKWLKLIEEAPDTFSIRGDIVWKEEENEEGYWEQTRNRMKRETMQSELENLIGLAVKASNNNQFIIHFGI